MKANCCVYPHAKIATTFHDGYTVNRLPPRTSGVTFATTTMAMETASWLYYSNYCDVYDYCYEYGDYA